MTILPLRLSDVKQVALLESKYIFYPYSEAILSDIINDSAALALKVSDGEKVVAYISGKFIVDEFEINNVVVDEPYRRKGYAEALINEVVSRCKHSGVKKIYLEVATDNEAAKNLYYKLGFEFLYERKRYYGEKSALTLVKLV